MKNEKMIRYSINNFQISFPANGIGIKKDNGQKGMNARQQKLRAKQCICLRPFQFQRQRERERRKKLSFFQSAKMFYLCLLLYIVTSKSNFLILLSPLRRLSLTFLLLGCVTGQYTKGENRCLQSIGFGVVFVMCKMFLWKFVCQTSSSAE